MSNYERRFIPERRVAVLWGFSVFLCSQVQEILVVIGLLPADLTIFPILWLSFKNYSCCLLTAYSPHHFLSRLASAFLSSSLTSFSSGASAFASPPSHSPKCEGGRLPRLPAKPQPRAWTHSSRGTSKSEEREIPTTGILWGLGLGSREAWEMSDNFQ